MIKIGKRQVRECILGMFISIAISFSALGAVTWDKMEMFEAFEVGEMLQFNNSIELKEFLSDYLLNYRIKDIRHNYTAYKTDAGISITMPDIKRYNRDELLKAILNKFGTPVGGTDFDKLVNACNRVTESIMYNSDLLLYPVDKVIEYNMGVCWHYAKLVQVLLESVGIKSEMIACKLVAMPRNSHVILRSKIGNSWVYTDPTLYKTLGIQGKNYLNISESKLAKEYMLIPYIGNNWTGIKEDESGDSK